MPDKPQTVLGFDFGLKRIGVAVGNALLGSATPLAVLPAQDGAPDWPRIHALREEWQPDRLLVGLPLNMDGSESDLSARARRFANRLNGRLGLPVELVDERLTSFAARGELLAAGTRRGKPGVDALAASLIVESWLSQHARESRDANA